MRMPIPPSVTVEPNAQCARRWHRAHEPQTDTVCHPRHSIRRTKTEDRVVGGGRPRHISAMYPRLHTLPTGVCASLFEKHCFTIKAQDVRTSFKMNVLKSITSLSQIPPKIMREGLEQILKFIHFLQGICRNPEIKFITF